MQGQDARSSLRHLAVEGSPQQAATMLSALLLGYAGPGPERASLLCEVAFAQLMADEPEAALATARRAVDDATHESCATAGGARAHAAAALALALSVRGPAPRTPPSTLNSALEAASDLLLDLDDADPVAPMATYLVAEAALLQGRFVAAEQAAARGRSVSRGSVPSDPQDPIALVLNELVLARSLVLRGRRREGAVLATRAASHASRMSMSALEGVARALEAVIGAAAGDRAAAQEAERRAQLLSSEPGRSLCHTATRLLLAYAAFLQGRHAEATHLVVIACGGAELPRLPWTLRTTVFELLATAAAAEERLSEASAWLAGASRTESTPRADPRTSAVAALERSAVRITPEALRAESADADAAAATGGWQALTPRERHVAELASRGLTNRQIAERLFLDERSVRVHLERVYEVMGVHGRAQLPASLTGIVESRSHAPQVPLTGRQESVVALVAEGLTNAQVADLLGTSVKTVEKHLRDVFARWGVSNRSAAASAWRDYAESRQTSTDPVVEGRGASA